LGKQTNNSDQSAMVRWPIVPWSAWPIVPWSAWPIVPWSAWPIVPRVAKLKINVAQEKFILESAIILVKQCRDKQ